MFIQLTDRLIVPHHQIVQIHLVPFVPAIGDDDEVETTWGVQVALVGDSLITLFKGDRQEATQHFRVCATYLGQCHQRGVVPLHEVVMMVDPSPLQGVK